MTNFYAELDDVFHAHGGHDCLRFIDRPSWTFAALRSNVALVADRLRQQGVTPGDRVVVQVDKSPENLALYLATLCIGGVYVPLNTAYTSVELDYFVADAKPALFVGSRARDDVPSLTLAADGSGTLFDSISVDPSVEVATAPVVVERQPHDLAAIVYTSGTTGRSKGAMLSHSNLSNNAHSLCAAWDWQSTDVLLHALPIFHVHGLFIANHCALLRGTPMYWLPKFDVVSVQAVMGDCSIMMGVPTFYTRLLGDASFPAINLDHMRAFICGSAPLTEQVFLQWQARTGHRILERYGMSETIINTTNPIDGERVPATVGFPLPGLDLRIANDAGEALENGEVGAIEVRGPSVFGGYWQMPEKTAEEIRSNGFFITGDLGTLDDEGRLSIVGRAKDLVISGGYNVYPKEIEKILDGLPGVLESAVIGVPHADFGEAVVAVIVPQNSPPNGPELTLADVSAYLEGKLAKFKQPKALVHVDTLPRNTMGKVQKNLLRDAYETLLTH